MTVNQIAAGAAACCAVLFVSACSGTSAPVAVPTSPATATSDGAPGSGSRGFPGVTGMLAQVEGTTLQIQSTDTQTTLTYSRATTFSQTLAAGRSGVVVGICVQARTARTASGLDGARPPTTSTTGGTISAASVEISPAVKGACPALGGLRAPGARPPEANGAATRPSRAPRAVRTRGPGSGGTGFGGLGVSGKVTAVNSAGFTIVSSRPQGRAATPAVPVTRTVETSPATTYTQTRAADARALAVGLCVTALGRTDDTGSMAATSIMLRPPENGSCSSGLGRREPIQTPAGGGPGA